MKKIGKGYTKHQIPKTNKHASWYEFTAPESHNDFHFWLSLWGRLTSKWVLRDGKIREGQAPLCPAGSTAHALFCVADRTGLRRAGPAPWDFRSTKKALQSRQTQNSTCSEWSCKAQHTNTTLLLWCALQRQESNLASMCPRSHVCRGGLPLCAEEDFLCVPRSWEGGSFSKGWPQGTVFDPEPTSKSGCF